MWAATAKAAARLGKMRTRLTAGEKPNRKRMAALVTIYDAGPANRRPHDVIAPPGGRNGSRPLRPGPKALAKWLSGSVRKDPAEVIAAASGEAEARDPGHLRTWVVLAGGAEHQLDLIRVEAARRAVEIHMVIDLVHVLEYIWKAAWSLHDAGDSAAEDWVAVKALAVLAGRQRPGRSGDQRRGRLRRTGRQSANRSRRLRPLPERPQQGIADAGPVVKSSATRAPGTCSLTPASPTTLARAPPTPGSAASASSAACDDGEGHNPAYVIRTRAGPRPASQSHAKPRVTRKTPGQKSLQKSCTHWHQRE